MAAKSQADLFYTHLYTGIGPAIAQTLAPFSDVAILKPFLHYILGLGMVLIRVNTGNVTYFNGTIAPHSFHGYFPEIFVLKTQIAFLILLVALPVIALLRYGRGNRSSVIGYIKRHRYEFVMLSFVIYYFAFAIAGNLNLGIRHLLPIYPPLFVLVALGSVRLVRSAGPSRRFTTGLIATLLLWYGASTVMAYPHYISYFNGLLGGPSKASLYFSDSGIDWGQDLDRLKAYVDKHPEIDKIALDYFGGGVPEYTFCDHVTGLDGRMLPGGEGLDCSDSKLIQWHANYGRYTGQYIAISETYYLNELYTTPQDPKDDYAYLRNLTPIERVGNSIFIYKLY
jgi:hypothetical protein